MSNGRNRINPLPDPEREWWDKHKGKRIRVSTDLQQTDSLEGRLVWVARYDFGLEVVDPEGALRVNSLGKGFIVRKEPLE